MIKIISDNKDEKRVQPRVYRITDDLAQRIKLMKKKAKKRNMNELFEAMVSLTEIQIERELKGKK